MTTATYQSSNYQSASVQHNLNKGITGTWAEGVKEVIATIGWFYRKQELEAKMGEGERNVFNYIIDASTQQLIRKYLDNQKVTSWGMVRNSIHLTIDKIKKLQDFIIFSPYIAVFSNIECASPSGGYSAIHEVTINFTDQKIQTIMGNKIGILQASVKSTTIKVLAISQEMWDHLDKMDVAQISQNQNDCCIIV